MNAKIFVAGVMSSLILVGIALGAYFLGKNTGTSGGSSFVTPTVTPSTSLRIPSPINIVSPTPAPKGATKEVIQTTVVSGNYESLSAYMTNPVSVRIEASECCSPMTPEAAVVQLKYLDSAKGAWNFNNQEVMSSLEASYPENYGNAIIGVTSDDYLVGFQLNAQSYISKISMSSTYKLLLE